MNKKPHRKVDTLWAHSYRDAKQVATVSILLFVAQWWIAGTPTGERLEAFEYGILQESLIARSDASRWQTEDLRLPIVIDISSFRMNKEQPTDRAKLEELVDSVRELNASAIGVDVDFSPEDDGRFVTARDPQLFDKWQKYGNVRVGVFRREGDVPEHWLGRPEFRTLAAGMMLPPDNSDFAYHYTSGDLSVSRWAGGQESYLLQMPSALHEITDLKHSVDPIGPAHLLRTVIDGRIAVGKFPIDYSFVRLIQTIRYRNVVDLTAWRSVINRRTVLIGDMSDAGDLRCTNARPEPLSGVVIHAAALATLTQPPLMFVDGTTSTVCDAVLCCVGVVVMAGLRWAAAKRPHVKLNEREVEILTSAAFSLFFLVLGVVAITRARLFWPDAIWLAATVFVHPYLTEVLKIAKVTIHRVVWRPA